MSFFKKIEKVSATPSYIEVNSKICNGCVILSNLYVYNLNQFLYRETLHIKTKSQELIALCITHAKDILKDSIAAMPDVINCLYDDDLFPVNSKDEGYTYI